MATGTGVTGNGISGICYRQWNTGMTTGQELLVMELLVSVTGYWNTGMATGTEATGNEINGICYW
jgi:hypothetical protein